jgi:hypothetical protein
MARFVGKHSHASLCSLEHEHFWQLVYIIFSEKTILILSGGVHYPDRYNITGFHHWPQYPSINAVGEAPKNLSHQEH